MGFCYELRGSRRVLCCDNCGVAGGVRRRPCKYKVLGSSLRTVDGQRHALPYCPAPALCTPCFRALGGGKALHAQCEAPALEAQRDADAEQVVVDSGVPIRVAGFGTSHEDVPVGKVGVVFSDGSAYLVDDAEYDNRKAGTVMTLADFPSAVQLDESSSLVSS